MATTKPVTVLDLRRMKAERQKITMLTAYDAMFARLVDEGGVDVILVGDSLGMVVQGHKNTLPVTIEHMAYHGAAVARSVERAHVVVDMPFLSYHVSIEEAVRNAGMLLKNGAHSVKLEGGAERADTIRALVDAQIPVMAHIGLTPQSFHAQGGFKVQGRGNEAAERLMRDALAVQEAGAYSLVLEGIPDVLATEISAALEIPTIGIGAGSGCDGQVLVIYDLLGMDKSFKPKFVKRYAQLQDAITGAVGEYVEEVRSGAFPDDAHSFHDKKRAAAAAPAAVEAGAPRLRAVYGPSES
ncbi:MAG: 3-methyl-2-oxobutanoate hydroxymethyltransferase [Deltaproteobacteria bacterium]|nr:3-methyl-2-oxobutanoate hydroxymethyltransferase [Deltaproteobacteria bacterium]